MEVIEVNEKKWATLLVLYKMLNYEISEENAIFPFILIRGETRKIKDTIVLDDMTYKIKSNLLEKIVFELQVEKVINTPLLTEKGYTYCIKNREKLSQRMLELNSIGITLDKFRDSFGKNKINKIEGNGSMSFNLDNGILIVRDKDVKVRKFSKQYSFLKVLFDNEDDTGKDWQFSEIAENMDSCNDDNWKKLYDVADAISKKVAIETGIKDIFITTTQSIKINPKYI